ncbi:hypothetical protein [Niallia taxi]|uniref:hypothetical protein n=1 Tax=Niallia taxi TaxID=2499688 RepID=UPI00300B819E
MSKHTAIFRGLRERKMYKFGKNYTGGYFFIPNNELKPEVYDTTVYLDNIDFYENVMQNPPLEIGEKVYLEEFDKTIKIVDRERMSSGGYRYITGYVAEVVEDDETEKSRIEAFEKEADYIEQKQQKEIENSLKVIDDKLAEFDEAKIKKKWFVFWK